ncbi:MAG: hypothetical protein ACOC2U_00010 [bacterium]
MKSQRDVYIGDDPYDKDISEEKRKAVEKWINESIKLRKTKNDKKSSD